MQKENSVYYRAAVFGLPLGLLLTAASACFILMQRIPFLATFILLILAFIPFFVYRGMKRLADGGGAFGRLATLWVFGIYSFIFGTLVCSLISAFYLVVFDPSFVYDSMNAAIDSLKSVPDAASVYAEQIDVMQRAIDRHLLPSPMEFVISMGWSSSFFGSMLSLPLAFLVSRKASHQSRNPQSVL